MPSTGPKKSKKGRGSKSRGKKSKTASSQGDAVQLPANLRARMEYLHPETHQDVDPFNTRAKIEPIPLAPREETQPTESLPPPRFNLFGAQKRLPPLRSLDELPPIKGWKPRPVSSKPRPEHSHVVVDKDPEFTDQDEEARLELERELQYQRLMKEELNILTWTPKAANRLPAVSSAPTTTQGGNNTPAVAAISTTTTITASRTATATVPYTTRLPHPPTGSRVPHPPSGPRVPRPPTGCKTNSSKAREVMIKQRGDGKMVVSRHRILTAKLRNELSSLPPIPPSEEQNTVQETVPVKPHPPATPNGRLLCKRPQIGNSEKIYLTSNQEAEFKIFGDHDVEPVNDDEAVVYDGDDEGQQPAEDTITSRAPLNVTSELSRDDINRLLATNWA